MLVNSRCLYASNLSSIGMRDEKRRILLTGSAGYIGPKLTCNLLARNYEVVVLDFLGSYTLEEKKMK